MNRHERRRTATLSQTGRFDGIAKAIAELLDTIVANGGSFPVLLAAVGLNGQMYYGRYDYDEGDVTCTVLSEHSTSEAEFQLPVNLMFVDGEGNAYRGLIDTEGTRLLH